MEKQKIETENENNKLIEPTRERDKKLKSMFA